MLRKIFKKMAQIKTINNTNKNDKIMRQVSKISNERKGQKLDKAILRITELKQ